MIRLYCIDMHVYIHICMYTDIHTYIHADPVSAWALGCVLVCLHQRNHGLDQDVGSQDGEAGAAHLALGAGWGFEALMSCVKNVEGYLYTCIYVCTETCICSCIYIYVYVFVNTHRHFHRYLYQNNLAGS